MQRADTTTHVTYKTSRHDNVDRSYLSTGDFRFAHSDVLSQQQVNVVNDTTPSGWCAWCINQFSTALITELSKNNCAWCKQIQTY